MHDGTYTLAGKQYHLRYATLKGKNSGYCANPSAPPPREILVHIGKSTPNKQRVLRDLIHEALHACVWDLSEETVARTGRDIARMLWDQGLRFTEE